MIICARKIENVPPVMIGSDRIDYCDKVTSLGVVVDTKLSNSDHVNEVCAEVNGCLCMLRQFTPLIIRQMLVKALLIPKLTYCSIIFMGCSRASWKKINIAFNSCLRYIYQLRKYDSLSRYQCSFLRVPIEKYLHFRASVYTD